MRKQGIMSAFIFNDPFRGRQVFTNPGEVLGDDVKLELGLPGAAQPARGLALRTWSEKIEELRDDLPPGLPACRVPHTWESR